MTKFTRIIRSFVLAEEGATMVEYGLMIALIAAAGIAVVTTLGTTIAGKFTTVGTAVGGGAAGP